VNIHWPYPEIAAAWEADEYKGGTTEPWTQQIVADMASALPAKRIIETGTFMGLTTLWLISTGAHVTTVDSDPERAENARKLFKRLGVSSQVRVISEDSLSVLRSKGDDSYDFAFLDDDHTADHVYAEITEAKRIVRPGGIIAVHDVIGPFNLRGVIAAHGGASLPFCNIHAGGGLGVIGCTD
jgi:predicted O-methyltransferase YrrM